MLSQCLSLLLLGTLIFSPALFRTVLVPTHMFIGYKGFPGGRR